ncbi:MAG: hypothetical protein CL678_16340 [Bdellovibrionaceae bacterium]|nr:hypothetical protein [Pseudobdellovibrionaceae bacterium]|tara:strand:- start:1260 stop:1496 length:237 start_codon:yes stop_codon:yes gene_type:complete
MTPDELKIRLEALGPDTQVEVDDLTGTQNHYQATIESSVFEGKSMIQQHQMVYALVKEEMASNEVHALSLKTSVPKKG